MLSHALHPSFQERRYRNSQVLIIGSGGTGSRLVVGLKNLVLALHALGGVPLEVTLADGDTVSEANLVRQAYYPSDVGQNKATVLINRLNLSCGLSWKAIPQHLSSDDLHNLKPDILISCVDSRAARAEIQEGIHHLPNLVYHLDSGNTLHTGQVVLGCPENCMNRRSRTRLRTAYELFPELTDTSLPEEDAPSCSTLDALNKQDLFVNETLSVSALNLLWQLFRQVTSATTVRL